MSKSVSDKNPGQRGASAVVPSWLLDDLPLKQVRGLSLTRPWQFAFDHGKRIENRSWPPPQMFVNSDWYIALHAAKGYDEGDAQFISDVLEIPAPRKTKIDTGYFFAVCRVREVIQDAGDQYPPLDQEQWFFGPYGWVLKDYVSLIEPVPCAGAQGLWGFSKKQNELAELRRVYQKSL